MNSSASPRENPIPIYLDHAATTPAHPKVVEAVCFAMTHCTANPSAPYTAAGHARAILRQARQTLADMLGAQTQELFFTGGGTEANNWALHQAAGRHVVLSATEHKSVLQAAQNQGCSISLAAPNAQGVITPAAVESVLRQDTALVSVHLVNNETGVLQPIAQIGELTRPRGILLHCDGVQGFGQLPVRPHDWGVDLLSSSAHKLYGPRGVGFLFIRQGLSATPLLAGGGQELGLRSGTENLAGIHGFAVAAQLAQQDMTVRWKQGEALQSLLLDTLSRVAPDVTQLCSGTQRVPGITPLLLPKMTSEEMIALLDIMGIQVSGGAACASHSGDPSHVFTALGLTPDAARRVIRISTGRHTTPNEIVTAATAIGSILAQGTLSSH